MRNYQLVLVTRPSLNEGQRKKVVDNVKGWLKDLKITKEEDWGQKPLAYRIQRETSGHYLNILLESENGIPQDFEKRLQTTEEVIRHLLLRINIPKQKTDTKKEEKKVEEKKEKKETKKK